MERSAKSPPEQTRGRLTDARASPRRANAVFVGNRVEPAIQREGIDSIHKSACMVAQRKRLDTVDNSPRMVAQRNQIRSMFGEAVQLEDGPDEDELLRGRFGAIQRQGPEYEELRMPGSVASFKSRCSVRRAVNSARFCKPIATAFSTSATSSTNTTNIWSAINQRKPVAVNSTNAVSATNRRFKIFSNVAAKFWCRSSKKGSAPKAQPYRRTSAFQVATWF